MVKAKIQKPKTTKQQPKTTPKQQPPPPPPQVKKKGKDDEFGAQLGALGLKIIQVTADGNCFFRSLADQLVGNEEEHTKYRRMVVQFIQENRDMFEPFIEDNVPFDQYCLSMRKDGTWAGHMEVQAASIVTHTNICIHRKMSPRWYVRNFDDRDVRMIHLSYHDWEHYNSVRLKEDTCKGPARPIIIKADSDFSSKSRQSKSTVAKAKGEVQTIIQAESIKRVTIGSGCENVEKIEHVLRQVGGDVDVAIEFLIAEQVAESHFDEKDTLSCSMGTSHGNDCFLGGYDDDSIHMSEQHNEKHEKNTVARDEFCNQNGSADDDTNLLHDEKKIPRNKACPCGSKKKYKSCCGTVAERSLAKISVNQMVEDGKDRRGKKQRKKGNSRDGLSSHGHGEGPPDLGALCI